MRGCYSFQTKITGVNTARTLATLQAPTGKVVELVYCSLTQPSNNTQFQIELEIANLTSFVAGSGFTSGTPKPQEPGDQAAASLVTYGSATSGEPTTYDTQPRFQESNIAQLGVIHDPGDNDKKKIFIGSAAYIGIRLNNAPPAATDFDLYFVFREIG